MFKVEAIAAAVLLTAGTLACAQGMPTGTDATPASRAAVPANSAETSANRGKPTKEQKTFNESRSNSLRMPAATATHDAADQRASKVNTSKSNLRTGNTPVEAADKPAPPASTSGTFK